MIRWIFPVYIVLELAAFFGLGYLIGFGWTFLLIIALVILGIILLLRRRKDLRTTTNTGNSGVLVDGSLLGLSAIFLVIPGIITSVIGVLLLLKPVRAIARPAVIAIGARKLTGLFDRLDTLVNLVNPHPIIDGEILYTEQSPPASPLPKLEKTEIPRAPHDS